MRLNVKSAVGLKLPAGKSDHIEFDDDIAGFGIRIREGGSRTWVYQYRIGSKQRRLVLGSVKSVPLALARENAGKLEARVRLGGDPAMDKETSRREAADTFGGLVEQYLEARKPAIRARSFGQITRHLTKYAKPLHRLPITAVSQRNVAGLLTDLAKEAGEVTSNRVRASLSAFLGWAIREGIRLPEGNVVSHTNKRQEKSRERVLGDAELKAIWNSCLDDDYGRILKLLMLTGQRADEIARLRWDEVHDEQIELPGARTKNGRAHAIPLSEPAKAILAKLQADDRTHVFGQRDSGFQGWNHAKEKLVARMAEAGASLPHWVPHDLRRTAATRMADIGVLPHVVEATLNHISGHKGGIAGVYNKAVYSAEKTQALNRWADHLMAVVESRPPVVVPMKRG
jgi:integrase